MHALHLNPAHNNPVDIFQAVIPHILKQNMKFALGAACLPSPLGWGKGEYRDTGCSNATVWQNPGEICFHLSQASALRVEEELKEQQQQKAASLRRFQGEVRQRVNRQVRLRRRHELQRAYEAVSEALSGETPPKPT